MEHLGALVQEAKGILLTGPDAADGDSLGACLALARAIRSRFQVPVDVAGDCSPAYRFLPDTADLLDNRSIRADYGLVVVLDGDCNRLARNVEAAFRAAPLTAIVDHHRTTTEDGYTLALINPESASTCEMVLEIMDAWGVEPDRAAAIQLYTGILFDTGGFRYSNTGPGTHAAAGRLLKQGIEHADIAVRVLMERTRQGVQLAAAIQAAAEFQADGRLCIGRVTAALMREIGATDHDLGGVVESLLYIEGVEVSALLSERKDSRTKISFRSRGAVDVAALAKSLHPGGGGHAKAAGVMVDETLEEICARLPALVADRLGNRG
jgi:phosphoesterase RecJ-like protein